MESARRAAVLTVSDGVVAGTREDESGRAVADVLERDGYSVIRRAVPDERDRIEDALRELAEEASLVVTTGGTGFGPRDVTPEATRRLIDREAPGLAEAMRAAGRSSTPMADLSRGIAGSVGGTLVLNLPGSPRGAVEGLDAVLGVLPHALDLLAGNTAHGPGHGSSQDAGPSQPRDLDGELRRRRLAREPVVLATAVKVHGDPPCRVGQKLLLSASGPLAGTLGCAEFDGGAAADAPAVLEGGEPAVRSYQHELGTAEVFLEPIPGLAQLVVLGATPVALWLLRWGRHLGYETILVDARSERITEEHRRAADRVAEDPDEIRLSGGVDAVHTDHDAPGLADHVLALLKAGARFVGVMGSTRHTSPHLEALRDRGVGEEDLARVRTPVGLDIGARSPEEIAISILAGLIAARSSRSGGWLDRGERA